MDWGLRVMVAIALVIITAMGIWYIISAGNPGMINQAKSGITSTLIGAAVMLGAWLIVNTVLLLFAQETDSTKNPIVGLRSAGGFNWFAVRSLWLVRGRVRVFLLRAVVLLLRAVVLLPRVVAARHVKT